METKTLDFSETLRDSLCIGIKNAPSIIAAVVLYLVTIWIPYINIGTTIAITLLPTQLAKGEVINPASIFDSKYRRYMGEYLITTGLMILPILIAFAFLYIPGIVLSLAWSLSYYFLIEKGKNPMEAIKASNDATYGSKWTMFFVMLVFCIVFGVTFGILGAVCSLIDVGFITFLVMFALVVLAIVFGTAITATLIYAFFYVMFLFYMAVSTHGKETAIPFADIAVCVVAGFLFPAMYSCIGLLRNVSPAFVLMPFVIAFIGDSFSMLGGMAFGHKKFAPHVSPNKTWAGFLAGPVGSALGMVLLGLVSKWLWQMELPLWYLAVIGIAANLFGQLGDLSMSLIKREAGIKDYSHIFLTHGGVLDRFDSTLFLVPVVYAMLFLLEKLV